jgi:hypothetical protein
LLCPHHKEQKQKARKPRNKKQKEKEEQNKTNTARALFLSSYVVDGDNVTCVSLFLLSEPSDAFAAMLWRSGQRPSYEISATRKGLAATLSTFDEVEVSCAVLDSRRKEIQLDSIRLLRPRQQVLAQQERVVNGWRLLSSCTIIASRGNKSPATNNKAPVVTVKHGEEMLKVALAERFLEMLHHRLACETTVSNTFWALHQVPFDVLVSVNKDDTLVAEAVYWNIDSYLEQHGIRLKAIDYLQGKPTVLLPHDHYRKDLCALACPAGLKTEDQLRVAVEKGALQCCVLFAVPPQGAAAEAKNKKAKK